ncbi:MAG: hypothetical protein KGN79_12085 [Acidobacteriota bacterium]|nr:hypothetical protein [Acidobacteriota bacterium]
MDRHCRSCGSGMEEAWSFCPRCGAYTLEESHARTAEEHTAAPVRGLVLAAVTSFGLIAVGVCLFFTGWGMVLGAPLVLVGAITPLAVFSLGEQVDKCPFCGVWVLTGSDHKQHACPHCNRQFAVDEHHSLHPA